MKFSKYSALGNDYIVIFNEKEFINKDLIRLICDRHNGVGADGVLYIENRNGKKLLRIFNSDGSESLKSGNGLRICAKYLYDNKLVNSNQFNIYLLDNNSYECVINNNNVMVYMGRISFKASDIPTDFFSGEVINKEIEVINEKFNFTASNIGNPHCSILKNNISKAEILKYGPYLEKHKFFKDKANVQFIKILDKNNIKIQIWERGSGYTLASGSSSSASAAVVYRLGLCNNNINVHMEGGIINVKIDKNYNIYINGKVDYIFKGDYEYERMGC